MAGEVEMTFDTVASAGPLIKAGKLRALAAQPPAHGSLPQLPTLSELGQADASFEGWYALAAPAHTPAAVLQRLGRELRAVMALPEVQQQFRAQALEPLYGDPAMMTRLMEQEITQFRAAAARARLSFE
jgi:tripartite-type tricarboxylate transporter receptor subunit TctC